MEFVKPELELFRRPVYQNQIEKSVIREFTPISTIQHQTPIEFLISPLHGYMPDFSRSYVYIKAKITKADGTDIADDAHVGTVNIPIHSMWSSVEVYLGDIRISDANSMYAYRAIVETLLSNSPEALTSQKQSAIYAKDTAKQMDHLDTNGAEAKNLGLVERFKYFKSSAEVEMMDRLHIDLCYPELLLPTALQVRIRLIRSPDKFVIMAKDNTEHKFLVTSAKIFVPYKALSDAQAAAFEITIAKNPVRFPIRRVALKHLTIPAGLSTSTHDNIIMGRLPKRLIMFMVAETAMAGALKENPFNFQHFNLNYAVLHVNGDLVPARPFQPDFATGQYIREFMSLYDVMDITNKGRGIIIDRNDYGNGYTLLAFDLSSDQSPNSQIYDARRTGNIRLELRFNVALPKSINVILYGDYLGEILIDRYRNVITDY